MVFFLDPQLTQKASITIMTRGKDSFDNTMYKCRWSMSQNISEDIRLTLTKNENGTYLGIDENANTYTFYTA